MATIIPYRDADLQSISAAMAAVVQTSGIVAIPTETYYGLGVDPFQVVAVERLIAVKGRPDGKPILVLIGDQDQLTLLVASVPSAARLLMDAFWPGALTVVLPALPHLPVALTAGTGTVGVRLTACAPLAAILKTIGPLTGTSANRSGEPPLFTAAAVQVSLGEEIAMIVDAGPAPGGAPSTVVRVVEDEDVVDVVREGVITCDQIRRMLEPHAIPLRRQ